MRQSNCFMLCFLIYQITTNQLLAQYFSLLPDINKDGQAQNYNIIVKDDRFFIIGDLEQVITRDVIPVISEFDYSGNLLRVDTIRDPNYNSNFYMTYSSPMCQINDSIHAFVFFREVPNIQTAFSYLMTLNVYSKTIVNSKIEFLDQNEFITTIDFDPFFQNIIAASYSYAKPYINKILTYSPELVLLDSFTIIDSSFRINLPQYINANKDSLLIMGQSADKRDFNNTLQIWGMHVQKNDIKIKHKRIVASRALGLSNFLTNLFIKNDKNEIVIASTHYKTGIISPNDYNYFINPIKVSYNIDSLIWELPLFTKNINSRPRRLYNAMAYIKSEHSYIVVGDEIDKNGACILFKFSDAGDSIWFKRIVPGFLYDTAVGFVPTYNIKTTPMGGVLITGNVHLRSGNKIRPYIMHLDYDGCLVPGCNTNTFTERDGNNIRLLTNPVSNNLVLKSEINANDVFMEIIDIRGNVIVKRKMNLLANSEYVWFASDLHVGVYVLKLYTKSGRILYTEKFIKS